MAPLSLRIDMCIDEAKAWAETMGFGGFCVRETVLGENEHWHWLLETDKKIQAVRTSLNRAIPALKGNGKYSLTEVKELDKYEKYMCKGESEGTGCEVAWKNSMLYTEEKIEELHVAYWTANRKLKKRTAGSMIDFVVDAAKTAEVAYGQREKLSKIYIRELGKRGKPINLFSIRSNLNSIQLALCPDDTILDQLADCVTQY